MVNTRVRRNYMVEHRIPLLRRIQNVIITKTIKKYMNLNTWKMILFRLIRKWISGWKNRSGRARRRNVREKVLKKVR